MLPGVSRLYWMDADLLPSMMTYATATGDALPIMTDLAPVPFCSTPTIERTTKTVNGKNVHTVTLKFFTRRLMEDMERCRNVAFVAVDANGQPWLIGSRQKPHCIITHTLAVPKPGDPCGVSYEVKHTAFDTPVKCTIYT